MRERAETPFAIYTAFSAIIHFSGETYYHVTWGQPLSAYVVDLISISLMLLASFASLKTRAISASGWLVAAWGFALCLNYRSFFSRYRALADGPPLDEPSTVLTILGITLFTGALAFAFAMYLARPRKFG